MWNRTIGRFGIVIALSLTTPNLGFADTLRDTLRNAYNHSGLLIQNRALLRAADEDVAQATTALRPIVGWTARYSYNSTSFGDPNQLTAGIGVDWLLYDFGRSQLAVEAVKETVLGTRQSLVSIEQDVLLRAVSAHLNYRRTVEFASLRAANVQLIQQELRAARDRFEVGEITRTDVALAEARLASARAGLAAAQGDRARAVGEYMAAVGRKPNRLTSPGALPGLPRSLDAAIARARKTHPALKQVQHSIAAAELSIQRAQLATRPSVSASASLGLTDTSGVGLTRNLSVTASGPIYSGGALASTTRKAMAQRDATRAQLHVVRHGIDQQVRNAFVLLDVARASGEASERQIRAARVAFRGVREEASLGARTTLDVLNAEQELLDARAGRISASVDEQIAAYTILASMGVLTAKDLQLGVKIYDPSEYYNLVKDAPAARSAQGQALDRVLKGIAGN